MHLYTFVQFVQFLSFGSGFIVVVVATIGVVVLFHFPVAVSMHRFVLMLSLVCTIAACARAPVL